MIDGLYQLKKENGDLVLVNISQICNIEILKNEKTKKHELNIIMANNDRFMKVTESKKQEELIRFCFENFLRQPEVIEISSPFEIKPQKDGHFLLYESGTLIGKLASENEAKIAQKRIEISRLK